MTEGRFLLGSSDDYEDEMAARLSPDVVEAILSGRPLQTEDRIPAEVRSALDDVRRTLAEDPSPELTARHLAAMVAASRSAEATARVLDADGGRSPMRNKSPWLRPARVAALGLAACLVLTGGLAFAGALPAPVQDALADVSSAVGLDLPEGTEVPEEAAHGMAVSAAARSGELSGCELGMAVAEVASSKAEEDPDLPEDACARGEDSGAAADVAEGSGSGSGSGGATDTGGAGGGGGGGGTDEASGGGAGGGGSTDSGGAGGGGGGGGTEQGSGGGSGSGGGGTDGGSGSGSGGGGAGSVEIPEEVPTPPPIP